ncbi:UNVERIFIED_CONTAM: putative UDP-rhamnose:rhamnosyltransferase 1 [Sesamum calycinum]|uniref:UDP-rhamnose:rhamnosyltransferase 1 n=1 Tax=Sesamum calycinum TaxID=2727403 RepID=A0AAW2JDK1_9LAMI
MAAKAHKSLHIAVFPWLAFGHIIPYLELSKHIAQKGHRISFISTPRNIDRLPELPPHLSSSIALVKIPLPRTAELPENAEATMDIHGGQMDYLKKAFDGLEAGLTCFLEDSRPDWIIYDFAAHWLPPVAARLGISRAFFLIINAWFLAFYGAADTLISGSDYRTKPEDFTVPPKWVKFETKVAYRRFEAEWHCHEFEPKWLTLLEELHHRPVIPLGLMPPKVLDHSINNDNNHKIWTPIKNWLDDQNRGSVLYVALGSEVTPTQNQVVELAYGLELSGVPFFWVLREVSGSDSIELPSGFEERVSGRGIVWRSWAPQLEILSHESVGGFLTHCGVVVEKQLGIEIPRNDQDGSYTKNSVADSIKLVMIGEEGRKLKERAREVSVVFGDMELHNRYMNDAIEFLKNHTSATRKIIA